MRFFSLALFTLIIAVSATLTPAQQPPGFTYYRLAEPSETSASRAYAVAVNDSGHALVGGQALIESVMTATSIYVSHSGDIVPLPCPDSLHDSRAVSAEFLHCDSETLVHAGGWFGAPEELPAPIVWYGVTQHTPSPWLDNIVLPTLGGSGIGMVQSIVIWTTGPYISSIWLVGCAGGIKHAVAWAADSVQGPYTLELMGDYGPAYRSQANDGVLLEDSTLHAVGWAETPGGLMLPQNWSRDQQGTWTRTPMPLPEGAVEGAAVSLSILVVYDILDIVYLFSAGWVEYVSGTRHGALWTYDDTSGVWGVEDLGCVDGYAQSAALGVCIRPADLIPDSSFDLAMVGTSYTGDDSVATLWGRDSEGTVGAHNLNDLCIVPDSSFDLSLSIAADITTREERIGPLVISGWGVETGGGATLGSPSDPHAFLLIEELAEASVRREDRKPASLKLEASPNPFSAELGASYTLGRTMPVRLAVYDVEGRLVTILEDDVRPAGEHRAVWEGLDSYGRRVGSGIYLLRLEAGDRTITGKAVFLR